MGDGFLASWRDGATAPAEVSAALIGFRDLQSRAHLAFRIVIHRGVVAVGGAPTLGEESLMSGDLSFAFRIEKLAGSLGLSFLITPAAAAGLTSHLATVPVPGRHEIKGFPPVEGLATISPAGDPSIGSGCPAQNRARADSPLLPGLVARCYSGM